MPKNKSITTVTDRKKLSTEERKQLAIAYRRIVEQQLGISLDAFTGGVLTLLLFQMTSISDFVEALNSHEQASPNALSPFLPIILTVLLSGQQVMVRELEETQGSKLITQIYRNGSPEGRKEIFSELDAYLGDRYKSLFIYYFLLLISLIVLLTHWFPENETAVNVVISTFMLRFKSRLQGKMNELFKAEQQQLLENQTKANTDFLKTQLTIKTLMTALFPQKVVSELSASIFLIKSEKNDEVILAIKSSKHLNALPPVILGYFLAQHIISKISKNREAAYSIEFNPQEIQITISSLFESVLLSDLFDQRHGIFDEGFSEKLRQVSQYYEALRQYNALCKRNGVIAIDEKNQTLCLIVKGVGEKLAGSAVDSDVITITDIQCFHEALESRQKLKAGSEQATTVRKTQPLQETHVPEIYHQTTTLPTKRTWWTPTLFQSRNTSTPAPVVVYEFDHAGKTYTVADDNIITQQGASNVAYDEFIDVTPSSRKSGRVLVCLSKDMQDWLAENEKQNGHGANELAANWKRASGIVFCKNTVVHKQVVYYKLHGNADQQIVALGDPIRLANGDEVYVLSNCIGHNKLQLGR